MIVKRISRDLYDFQGNAMSWEFVAAKAKVIIVDQREYCPEGQPIFKAYYDAQREPVQAYAMSLDGSPWEPCDAITEASAKAYATRIYGKGYNDSVLEIAKVYSSGMRKIAKKRLSATKWSVSL